MNTATNFPSLSKFLRSVKVTCSVTFIWWFLDWVFSLIKPLFNTIRQVLNETVKDG